MKLRGPIITLVAVAVLGVILIAVNVSKNPAPAPAANQAAEASSAPEAGKQAKPAAAAETPSAAPSPPPAFPKDAAYVGHTSGGEVAVAVAVKNGKAAAYICDGESIEAWMQGEVTGGKLTLKGEGDAKLTAWVDGKAVFGRVWYGGKKWPYSAALAEPPAGLYEGTGTVNGESARAGWIVLPDGRKVGLMSIAGLAAPVPPLPFPFPPNCPPDCEGDEVAVDGGTLQVRRISGDELSAER